MNTQRRNTTKRGILVAIMIVCLIAVIGGTYARYIATGTVSGTAEVAKWSVKLNSTDISTASTTLDVTFTMDANSYVADNKIAPGRSGTATVALDLTGTEVAVDVTATLGTASPSLPAGMSLSAITLDGNVVTAGTPVHIDVANVSASHPMVLTLTWVNNEANNATDSAFGNTQTSVTVPINLEVKQHVNGDPAHS